MRGLVSMVAAVLVGCGTAPLPSDPVTPGPTLPIASTAPASPSPTASARPTDDPIAAVDLLACNGPPSDVGGVGEGITLETVGGATPQQALDGFLAVSPWVIPRSGYEPIGRAGDRHAYGYRSDGAVKVVVVVSRRFAHLVDATFSADELRTCASGEFGADADLPSGRRAWTHPTTGHVISDIQGPLHCGWESARLMHLEHADGSLDRQYVRDPNGVLPAGPLLEAYAEDVSLPDDATDSGYRSPEGFELWFSERDTAAYVVTPDGVERWPRAHEPIGCA